MLDTKHEEPSAGIDTILIFGFQGLRKVHGTLCHSLPTQELALLEDTFKTDALIYTGHVGISFDNGETIYGFNPRSPSAKHNLYEHVIPMLKTHLSFPGVITDDKKTFMLAQEGFVHRGWNTKVHVVTLGVPTPKFTELRSYCLAMSTGEKGPPREVLKYSFPFRKQSKEGFFFRDKCTANCATFPADILGLPIASWRTTMVQFLRDLHNDKVCSRVCDRATLILLGTEDIITPRCNSIIALAGYRERITSLVTKSLLEAVEVERELRKSYQQHLESVAHALHETIQTKDAFVDWLSAVPSRGLETMCAVARLNPVSSFLRSFSYTESPII